MTKESTWSDIKSEAIENYLKTIYQIAESGIETSVQEIAHRVGVSAPAVSKMLRHLAKHQLVTITPYRPVELTDLGRKIALEVIRHHRLIELYLTQTLGYGWDTVHAEAEKMEHHISEEFEDAIDRLLGFPSFDPHGDPIPTRDGMVPEPVTSTLDAQPVGLPVTVRRVTDENQALLRYLAERNLRPGTFVQILDREPFGGSLHLQVWRKDRGADVSEVEVMRITPDAARHVFVELCRTDEAE